MSRERQNAVIIAYSKSFILISKPKQHPDRKADKRRRWGEEGRGGGGGGGELLMTTEISDG